MSEAPLYRCRDPRWRKYDSQGQLRLFQVPVGLRDWGLGLGFEAQYGTNMTVKACLTRPGFATQGEAETQGEAAPRALGADDPAPQPVPGTEEGSYLRLTDFCITQL